MYKEKIQKAGFKLTKQRLMVLDLLKKKHEPLSAKQIHKKLKQKVDLASIYRIINLFKEIKIVFEERMDNKEYFYLEEKQHHHVICEECGYAECIPCEHLFGNIKNFSKISHNLTISGICNKCS